MENATHLAHEFSRVLREWLSPQEMKTVIERNRAEGGSGWICHSHDFCDANMAMHEGFIRAFGREPDTSEQADVDLWNAAWDMAFNSEFAERSKAQFAHTDNDTLSDAWRFNRQDLNTAIDEARARISYLEQCDNRIIHTWTDLDRQRASLARWFAVYGEKLRRVVEIEAEMTARNIPFIR